MSLWTPYETERALDLSKSAAKITVKNLSPRTEKISISSNFDCHLSPSLYSHRSQPCHNQRQESPPQMVPAAFETPKYSVYEVEKLKKSPRPFKAVAATLPSSCGAAADPDRSYAAFRAVMLEAMRARNGGSLVVSNPRMRRSVRRSEGGDEHYNMRRARNNAAAKRSRDLRKQKEDELAIRAAFLERANAELREQIVAASRCHKCQTYVH